MKQNSGFTILELVIALTVLIVGLVGVISVIPLGQKSAKDAAEITQAAMLATEKLGEIKAYGYERVAEDPPSFPLTGQRDGVSWSVVISDVLDSDFGGVTTIPVGGLKKIVLTINYTVNNNPRTDVFHTFVAEF